MKFGDLERMEEEEGKRDFAKVREEFAEHVRELKRDLSVGPGGLTEEERIPVLQEFARWFLRECMEVGG